MVIAPLAYNSEEDIYLRGFSTPSPSPVIPSSATNSLPDSTPRVNKLNSKLAKDLRDIGSQSYKVQKHLQRSMDANSILVSRVEMLEASLKKTLTTKAASSAPKSKRTILNTRDSVL